MQDSLTSITHPDDSGKPISSACRPVSASSMLTGGGGVAAALVFATMLYDWTASPLTKELSVLGLSAAIMIAIDVFIYRVQSNDTTGLSRQPLRSLDVPRVARKLLGFWLTIGVIAILYAIIPEYKNEFYQPYKDAA